MEVQVSKVEKMKTTQSHHLARTAIHSLDSIFPVFYLLHTFSLKMESHNFPYPFLVCVCVSHIKKQFLHTIWCTTIRLILSGFCQR